MDWNTLVTDPLEEMLGKLMTFIPTLLGALIILIVGFMTAKLIRKLVIRALDIIKFTVISDKAGITGILKKGEVKLSASQIVGGLSYWLVMIMVLVMVVNALGLTVASQLLDGLLSYIPKIIAALFVLVLGLFLGNFVAGIVKTTAHNAGLPRPDLMGAVSKWALVIFATIISLKQLGIAPFLATSTFNIFFGGICLALALAFGLGGRDVAAKYLEEIVSKYSK